VLGGVSGENGNAFDVTYQTMFCKVRIGHLVGVLVGPGVRKHKSSVHMLLATMDMIEELE